MVQVKKLANKAIAYAFTVGVVIALILGLVSNLVPADVLPYLTSLLILAGIVVGFFNIQRTEMKDYVLFVTALVITMSLSKGALGGIQLIGPALENVLSSILAFILPSGVIVGVRAIVGLAKN